MPWANLRFFSFNPLPDDKILDWSKLKQIANDIFILVPYRIENIVRKGEIGCYNLQAISPFLTMFSTAIYLYWVKTLFCVVTGYFLVLIITSTWLFFHYNRKYFQLINRKQTVHQNYDWRLITLVDISPARLNTLKCTEAWIGFDCILQTDLNLHCLHNKKKKKSPLKRRGTRRRDFFTKKAHSALFWYWDYCHFRMSSRQDFAPLVLTTDWFDLG